MRCCALPEGHPTCSLRRCWAAPPTCGYQGAVGFSDLDPQPRNPLGGVHLVCLPVWVLQAFGHGLLEPAAKLQNLHATALRVTCTRLLAHDSHRCLTMGVDLASTLAPQPRRGLAGHKPLHNRLAQTQGSLCMDICAMQQCKQQQETSFGLKALRRPPNIKL